MRTIGLTCLLFMLLPVAEAGAETRKLNSTGFNEVSVGYGMRVSITQGDAYSVEVAGGSADLDNLEVKNEGSRVAFSMKSGWRGFRSGPINIVIKTPRLRRLDLSGGSRGALSMQTADRFEAEMSGGSALDAQLKAGDVDLNLSGGSKAGLSGSGLRLTLNGSGGSTVDMAKFAVTELNADLSGGSRASVALNGKLDADLSGGSEIVYYGNATMGSIDTSGGSKVRKGL
jgi:hypothetical protein